MPTVVGFERAGFAINAEDNPVFPVVFGAALNGEQAHFMATPSAAKRCCLSGLRQAGEQQEQQGDRPDSLTPLTNAEQSLEWAKIDKLPKGIHGFSIEFTIIHDR